MSSNSVEFKTNTIDNEQTTSQEIEDDTTEIIIKITGVGVTIPPIYLGDTENTISCSNKEQDSIKCTLTTDQIAILPLDLYYADPCSENTKKTTGINLTKKTSSKTVIKVTGLKAIDEATSSNCVTKAFSAIEVST